MRQDHNKFAVSRVSCCVVNVGLQLFVEAWNHHSVPLKGRPIDLIAKNNKTMPVDQSVSKERAAEHYREVTTRQLTSMSIFKLDPSAQYTNLQIRRETEIPPTFSFKSIFSKIQQENILQFRFSIQYIF